MLREYANNVPFDARGFVEQVGGYSIDSVAMGHKLRLPRDAWRTLIHSGITDLALHRFTVVHHRKCERQPLVVVSSNLATRQRHQKFSISGLSGSVQYGADLDMSPFATPRGWNASLVQFLGNGRVAGRAGRPNLSNYWHQIFSKTLRRRGSDRPALCAGVRQ